MNDTHNQHNKRFACVTHCRVSLVVNSFTYKNNRLLNATLVGEFDNTPVMFGQHHVHIGTKELRASAI